ncbi:MAG: hypothetical protein IPL61_25785 [Myxococcales bacterium]|nr:hypothetical protein [Myxococcales bacterium]
MRDARGPVIIALDGIDEARPAAAADRLVDEWLAKDPGALIVGLQHARLDTLCAVGAALERRGQLRRLDLPRQAVVQQCTHTWRAGASDSDGTVEIAAAAIVLRTADLAHLTWPIEQVIDQAVVTSAISATSDYELARLLAEGLLGHVSDPNFYAAVGGRLIWLVALALREPVVDEGVVWLAQRLAGREDVDADADTAPATPAELADLSAALAQRWNTEGEFVYLDGTLSENSGDEPAGAWVLLDDWGMFTGVPLPGNRGEPVVPAVWRALPAEHRLALARESRRRRARSAEWAQWLAAQRAALGL